MPVSFPSDTGSCDAQRLLQTQATLVLATADPEPWSAPVYYVYLRRRCYFFSSPTSRHVTAALAAGRCAGSVFRDSVDWRDIEGLQMAGRLATILPCGEATDAFAAYVNKFPTVKDLFADAVLDFGLFTERFRAQLYAFVPERACYLNNRAGFAHRQEIELPA